MDKFRKAQNWLSKLSSEAKFFRDKELPKLKIVNQILDELGRPDSSFEYRVVVTGTAGKGTVCRLTEDVLIRSGKKVTTLISPHIQVITERIRIDGKLISTSLFSETILEIKSVSEKLKIFPTYYEAIVLAGILAGKNSGSEILICEVGMGGEFDAVNSVQGKRIAALTFIGDDHRDILGPNISDIAMTKAGVFTKDSVLNLSYEQKHCSILNKKSKIDISYVKGVKARLNKKIARKISEQIMCTKDFIMQKPKMPARWEKLITSDFPNFTKSLKNNSKIAEKIILDGAHSAPRFEFILPKLKKIKSPKIGIFAMAKNHDAKSFSIISEYFDEIYWTKLEDDREFWEPKDLQKMIKTGDLNFPNPQDAFFDALQKYPNHNIFVMGSFYLCGEIREMFYPSVNILEQRTEFPV